MIAAAIATLPAADGVVASIVDAGKDGEIADLDVGTAARSRRSGGRNAGSD